MSTNLILLTICISLSAYRIVRGFPQGQPGEGGQDPCVQYQSQCVEGSDVAGQGANSGMAIFPNNPLPVNQVNMTAVQQMPYCDAMAQACRSQNGTVPAAPAAPSAPSPPPVPSAPAPPGLFNSFRSLFNI